MSFFELPPEEEEDDEGLDWREWDGPPEDEVGTVVPIERVLAETPDALVSLRSLIVYSTGFVFEVAAARRPPPPTEDEEADDEDDSFAYLNVRSSRFLRLGMQFADGGKATNLEEWRPYDHRGPEPPAGPILRDQHGRDSAAARTFAYWVWPLPPPGAVAFVCEWEAEGIPESRLEIAAQVIRDAAARPESIWPPV